MSTASSNVTFKTRTNGDDSTSTCPIAVGGKQNTPRGSPIAPSMRMPLECFTGVNNPGYDALVLKAGARCPADTVFVLTEAISKTEIFIHESARCSVGGENA